MFIQQSKTNRKSNCLLVATFILLFSTFPSIAALLMISNLSSSFSLKDVTQLPYLTIAKDASISRIAIGSCFAPQLSDDIFRAVANSKPDLFLFVGDNVYQSEEKHDLHLPTLKSAYNLLAQSPNFYQFAKSTPIIPTWDDHDFGFNDAGGSWPPKFNSESLFEHVWNFPKGDIRTQRQGIYGSHVLGGHNRKIQIITLDTRFFRTDLLKNTSGSGKYRANTSLQASLLGEAQWQWLEQELTQSVDLTLIVSSVQILGNNKNSEGWWQFPNERNKLLNLIGRRKNVILISGDRHFSALYKLERSQASPLYEYTSSSLNLPITGKLRTKMENHIEAHQIGKGIFNPNFASIQIDWDSQTLNIHTIGLDEKTIAEHQITFNKTH